MSIASALWYSGSASSRSPRSRKSSARLLSRMAIIGWLVPCARSSMASARLYMGSASSSLPCTRSSSARLLR